MKIFLMTFVALALLSKKHHILAFAWVTLGSIGLLAVKGGLFTIATAGNYRVWGPPESFIAGNNEFALATIVAIPMLHFLQLQMKKAWMRHAMTAVIVLSAIAALGSYSRGALLAIIGMGAVFWWRSSRKIAITCVVLVGALLALPMMPEGWWDRMSTISTYSQDASAIGRLNAWHVAWETAKNYFFGGGMTYQHAFLFEQYGPYEDTVRAAHSIYFEILGNHGFVGLFLFMMTWIAAYRSAGWLRTHATGVPEAKWAADLGAMSQASLAGFAIGGAFLSLPYFDLPYNLMVMILVTRKWVERKAWETEPTTPLFGGTGLGAPPVRHGRPLPQK
jgi:probable O-glycosylation ligase (exosortase A-associated)